MPYEIQKDGEKFCVMKKAGGKVPGGCHPTDAEAKKHMAALYAAETRSKKELTDAEEELIVKELESKGYAEDKFPWVPFGITTWDGLDAWRASQANAGEVIQASADLVGLINQTLNDPTVTDKVGHIKSLAEGFGDRAGKSLDDITEDDEENKEKGTASDNNLPDSAFLYVESGGKKDSSGKTEPRSLRHLPYKKADGSIDIPRLRNALSRLGQSKTGKVSGESWLSESLRSRLRAKAEKLLANANKSIGQRFKEWLLGDIQEEPEDEGGLMFWKNAKGEWLWFARYSNNFRDRDNPPEIIAAKSHVHFVDMVDKGIVPYPELWLWHRPELMWGKATWVAYDDSGFALAMGKVNKGCEAIAEAMSKVDPKKIRVSHGMPVKSIKRDPDDPTVIVEHVTAEISPLPDWAAANTLTSFTILKEESMPIPTEKRKMLIEEWKIPATVLDSLEAENVEMSKEAKQADIESKEADEPVKIAAATTPETPTQVVVPPTTPTSDEKESAPAPATAAATPQPTLSAQEIADAVTGVLNEKLTAINEKFTAMETALTALQSEVKALKESDETKIAEKAAKTPVASLSALISRSVIGLPDTKVDGRGSLAKQKPEETPTEDSPEGARNLGVWTVNQIIKETEKPKQSQ